MGLDKRTLKILKMIYRTPYITIAELRLMFPEYNDLTELLDWLASEKYISFREAGSPEADEGYEMYVYQDEAHLLALRKGNIAAEDTTLLRANIALIVSILSLAVAILALILR